MDDGSLARAEAVMEDTVEEAVGPAAPTETPGLRVRREARENTPCMAAH